MTRCPGIWGMVGLPAFNCVPQGYHKERINNYSKEKIEKAKVTKRYKQQRIRGLLGFTHD